MEAVWKIEVKDFPAFIIVDNKGNDFLEEKAGRRDLPDSNYLAPTARFSIQTVFDVVRSLGSEKKPPA